MPQMATFTIVMDNLYYHNYSGAFSMMNQQFFSLNTGKTQII